MVTRIRRERATAPAAETSKKTGAPTEAKAAGAAAAPAPRGWQPALRTARAVPPPPPAAVSADGLGPTASPLMTKIHAAAQPFVGRGSVPPELFATSRNAAVPAPLLRGPEIFDAHAKLIASAKSEVLFQTFVWEPGSEATNKILGAFKTLEQTRAREAPDAPPVQVKLLIDRERLAKAKWLPRLQADLNALGLDPRRVQVEVATFDHTLTGNLHVKTLVVDGQRALTTGANPEFCHDAKAPWFDSGYQFEGDVAKAMRADFADAWSGRGKSPIGPPPPPSSAPPSGPPTPMLVIGRKTDLVGRNQVNNTQDQAYLAAFDAAEKRIRIQTPNLNDEKVKEALVAAVKRGVTVQVIVSKGFNEKPENIPGVGGGNEKNVRKMLAELRQSVPEAQLRERFQVKYYSHDGKQPVVGNGPGASHAKYTSIDDQVVIVGSTNMDTASWNISRELDVVVDSRATTRAWDSKMFEPNFDRAISAY